MPSPIIQLLGPQELPAFRQLVQLFIEVFEQEQPLLPDEQLASVLAHPDFRVFVATHQGSVVGGLTLHVLHSYYSPQPVAYLYDLAVANTWQRQGIGKALMAYASEYCRQAGFETAYVAVEAADTEAVDFYRQTDHSSAMSVWHFTYQLQ